MKTQIPEKKLKFLKMNTYFMLVVITIAIFFLLKDFYESIIASIPKLGVVGYLTGPIFAHKISELYIGGWWVFVSMVSNYDKLGIMPTWITEKNYLKLLYLSAFGMIPAIILATYSWTIINLGTSPLTTNYTPLPLIKGQGEAMVWKYYLAVVILAGAGYIVFALRRVMKGLQVSWK